VVTTTGIVCQGAGTPTNGLPATPEETTIIMDAIGNRPLPNTGGSSLLAVVIGGGFGVAVLVAAGIRARRP
jgi:LPXTG-motif cell wall-anchored protein